MNQRKKMERRVLEIFMHVVGLFVLIPMLLIIVNSVKNLRESAMLNLALPTEWVFDNFVKVFEQAKILRGYMNSLVLSVFVVLTTCFTASLAAFTLQRSSNRLIKMAYYVFILGLIVPGSIIPTIKVMMDLHLHNTYFGIVMYYTAVLLPFSVFLLTGFMKTVPKELDDAAIIDGCSFLRLFSQIILPILQSVLVTVGIVIILNVWNDFMGPFYLISDSTKWTVTLTIFNFKNKYSTNWGLVFADMLIVISPVLIMYFIFQRHIIEGMTAGALKG